MIVKSNGVIIKEITTKSVKLHEVEHKMLQEDTQKSVLYGLTPICLGLLGRLKGVCESSKSILDFVENPPSITDVPINPLPVGSMMVSPSTTMVVAIVCLLLVVLLAMYFKNKN